jgi:hypothetical protein
MVNRVKEHEIINIIRIQKYNLKNWRCQMQKWKKERLEITQLYFEE